MRKLNVLFMMLLLIASTAIATAQGPSKDYFIGKWEVAVEGLPVGDLTLFVTLDRQDGKLTGTIGQSADSGENKISSITEEEKSITIYFEAQGYNVDLSLDKKGQDTVTGYMMGQFTANGKRVK